MGEKQGDKIMSVKQIDVGDKINLTFADGRAQATIIKKEN